MKIVIPGGTGQVGTLLARSFHTGGHEVVVLSRKPESAAWRTVSWDAKNSGNWESEIDGTDVVINLAGRSVNCRYTPENRRQIMDSRVRSAEAVGKAIAKAAKPPAVWLQMSTATIYSHRFDAANDDLTGIIGGSEPDVPPEWGFSIKVAQAWERAAEEADTPQTRKVLMRAALILNPDKDGIFDTLLTLVRRGLGGTAADGRQYISWIHEQDFVRSVNFLIEHTEISGAVNIASPNPLPNAEFMRILRRAWGTRIGLPAAKFMLRIGALLMQSEMELILKSRRVVPARMLKAEFTFDFPAWEAAARDLVQRWREQR